MYDILISGVGGQGTVLASKLLAATAITYGLFTRTAETIGMSQRGGSVTSHVRIGSENKSPVIPLGAADLIIGFEPSETVRNLARLSANGKCIVNTQVVRPVTASLNASGYDVSSVIEYIRKMVPSALFIDGYSLAVKAGSVKTTNVVLLGAAAAAGLLPFSREQLLQQIIENVPGKFKELNINAFNVGYDAVPTTELCSSEKSITNVINSDT